MGEGLATLEATIRSDSIIQRSASQVDRWRAWAKTPSDWQGPRRKNRPARAAFGDIILSVTSVRSFLQWKPSKTAIWLTEVCAAFQERKKKKKKKNTPFFSPPPPPPPPDHARRGPTKPNPELLRRALKLATGCGQ